MYFTNRSLCDSVFLFLLLPGRICLVAEKAYMTQIIYLYYAIEINVARIQALQLRHYKRTFQERFLRLSFVGDDSVGVEPSAFVM